MTTHLSGQTVDEVEAEPDYRFTLANERTFLAWIRTSFGLLAGGVAVGHLVSPFGSAVATEIVALGCLVLAAVLALGAFVRWRGVQQAMVRSRALPSSPLMILLAAGTAIIAVVSTVAMILT